jgi:hypothetical protein
VTAGEILVRLKELRHVHRESAVMVDCKECVEQESLFAVVPDRGEPRAPFSCCVFADGRGIVLDFGEESLRWLLMTPAAARALARSLGDKADEFEARQQSH